MFTDQLKIMQFNSIFFFFVSYYTYYIIMTFDNDIAIFMLPIMLPIINNHYTSKFYIFFKFIYILHPNIYRAFSYLLQDYNQSSRINMRSIIFLNLHKCVYSQVSHQIR